MNDIPKKINFCVVYTKTRKKVDKYFKVNQIKNKYVIDLKKMIDEHGYGKFTLKSMIFKKISQGMEKGKDIYYIPNFDEDFDILKLLKLKHILGENNFNILLFHDEFKKQPVLLDAAFDNLSKFDHSQIINDY